MRKFLFVFSAVVLLLTSLLPAARLSAQSVTAEDLRALLTAQIGEHVLLASAATNAALHGNNAEFEAAAAALDANSVDIAGAIGLVYGDGAGEAFLPLWRSHIGMFVDYAMGVASDDTAMQEQAVAALDAYRQDFGAFLAGANPNLTKEAVAEALAPHVMHLAGVVNAQAAQDYASAYSELRMGYSHAADLGLVLSGAIATQFPETFAGMVDSPASELRTWMVAYLGEHTALAAMATNAALQGRTDEFEAAAAALDNNSVDISTLVGTVYGQGAGEAFLPLWRSHIGMFVDYAMGVASDDTAMQEQAVAALDAYRQDFGAFLAGANPNLTKEAVAEALAPHVMHLAGVVNAQAAQDYASAYSELRMGYSHAGELGAVLGNAIATQFPDKFMSSEMMGEMQDDQGNWVDQSNMPSALPATGFEPADTAGSNAPVVTLAGGVLVALLMLGYALLRRQRSAKA